MLTRDLCNRTIDMKTLELQAQPQPSIDTSDATLVMSANTSQVASMRCAIHGTEMDYQRGNTYFCADCLGLPGKKHSRWSKVDPSIHQLKR